ncbi:MAG: chromate ion transporter family protein [Paenibacillus sp.]|nr:chromate ion transporter family protein [Paenibacillus sp.]
MENKDHGIERSLSRGWWRALLEVFIVSSKLGLTSFGGPTAHLGYFHYEYIVRRKWMDERGYADLVALCQFLPGPASSQVGIGIGIVRAGIWGGIISWMGFTLPSVIVLILFALLMQGAQIAQDGWIHGLHLVAVAVVAHALLGMGQKLAPDRNRMTLAVIAAVVSLLWQGVFSQLILLSGAALIGWWMYRKTDVAAAQNIHVPISRKAGVLYLSVFLLLLALLPFLRQIGGGGGGLLPIADSFYRAGSLVFGGGHVVLPLLEAELVPTGWISSDSFMAGYGAAQAIPGPLFTIAAYLGMMIQGITGALIAIMAIFLPAFLLIVGALPFWSSLRSNPTIQGALTGINAAVVGILLAALYDPLWTTAILTPLDFSVTACLFLLLMYWKLPSWAVVLIGGVVGQLISYINVTII